MNETIPTPLATYARAHVAMPGVVTELTPELRAALADFLAGSAVPEGDADALTLALELLESDPETAARLRNIPATPAFLDAPTIAVTTAVLIALQTHLKFERQPDGKFSILIEKKPTSDSLIVRIIEKLLNPGK